MKIIYVPGWPPRCRRLQRKVEDFVYAWKSSEENKHYSCAEFYGVIAGNAEEFTEIEAGEISALNRVQFLIKCDLLRGGREVHVTLLRY